MHETDEDIRALQALLDRSYESAGSHLRRITTAERRVDAAEVAARLQGMRLLVLATTTADGEADRGTGRRGLLPRLLSLWHRS